MDGWSIAPRICYQNSQQRYGFHSEMRIGIFRDPRATKYFNMLQCVHQTLQNSETFAIMNKASIQAYSESYHDLMIRIAKIISQFDLLLTYSLFRIFIIIISRTQKHKEFWTIDKNAQLFAKCSQQTTKSCKRILKNLPDICTTKQLLVTIM